MVMMKAVSLLALAFVAGCSTFVRAVAADDTPNTFGPPRFSYQQLEHLLHADDKEVPQWRDYFQSVLETVGLFCITDIPGMGHFKPQTLEHLDACIQEEQQQVEDSVVASHVFADGTRRQTLASTPGNPLLVRSKEKDSTTSSSSACVELEQNSRPFRETVAEVTRTVAELLRVLSGLEGQQETLLMDAQGGKYNLQNMVNEGEHLEHFHVYHKSGQTDTTSTTTTTLDWHTDQGLMLFFSPGIRYGEPTQYDFYIQLPDGQQQPLAVEFSPRDELVVMLGEGIQHYVNPHLPPNHQWRAVPHRLSVQDTPRIWYGRMVLPPPLALHPEFKQRTFGELRRDQIVHPQQYESFGCGNGAIATSSTTQRSLQTEDSCQPESQQYCWHRCMNFTQSVSPTACEATNNQTVACINAQRQLWTGDHNPDFSLACLDLVAAADEAADDANGGHSDEDGNKTEPHSGEGGSHLEQGHDDGDTPSAGVRMCVGVAVMSYSILGALLPLV